MADLVMKEINKSYGGVKALTRAEFSANRGEIHALLGENGAGKSTLIKILSGSIRPDSGSISLYGKHLPINGPWDAIKNGIGTVYQELSLIPDLSVASNIFYKQKKGKRFGIISERIIRQKTLELMENFGVTGIDPDSKVGDLSLSQRQLVEIIKVLSRDPEVLIFDEATSALTQDKVNWLLSLCRKLASDGKIVIFISHRMDELKQIVDRVTIFRSGQNVGVRKMSETNSDELVSLMLGRRVGGLFPEKVNSTQEVIVLETKNLVLGKLLKNINFQLRKGEILGVGGLAGQGQAALFLSLFGLYHPEGEILVNGKSVRLRGPKHCLREGIALVPEDRGNQGLLLSLSIRQNISLSILHKLSRFGLLSSRREDENVSLMMQRLQIAAQNDEQLVRNLSGGNQQKVVFAKLLLTDPQILLLYDCTRGVDVGAKAEIFKMVREMSAAGKSVLLYSTDVEELVKVCDRVLVMKEGHIVANLFGSILSNENIIRTSVGEEVGYESSKAT